MKLDDQIKAWHEHGLSCVGIGKKIRRNPSSVYYMMRRLGLAGAPIIRKTKADRRTIEQNFSSYEWQMLFGSIYSSKGRVDCVCGTYRITYQFHIDELKYLIWKVRRLNALKMIGTCKKIKQYGSSNQIIAEYSSSNLGPILAQLKESQNLPIYHAIAKTQIQLDKRLEPQAEMLEYLAEITEIVIPEFQQNEKSLCWIIS